MSSLAPAGIGPPRGVAAVGATPRRKRDAWVPYLLFAVTLAAVLVPPGEGRTALEDPVNAIAMVVFAISTLMAGRAVKAPFLGPVFVIALGSVLATFNAANPGAAILTMIQDGYLYAFFLLLVNLLATRGDFKGLRLAWVIAACLIALYGIGQVLMNGSGSLGDLLQPKGYRAVGSFDQPDELADYLVMSVFMVLSLNEEVAWPVRWSAIGILGVGIVATKANGGVIALAGGLLAWATVRAWTRRQAFAALLAGALFTVSLILVAVWMILGVGVGSSSLRELTTKSFLSRVGHSSEGREMIWGGLWHRYLRHPLGLGPGNSRWQTVTIEERERPMVGPTQTFDTGADPFLSKEAHNDYIAYLVERGPIALLFMLVLKFQVFDRILRAWRARRDAPRGAGSSRTWVRGGALIAAFFGAWVASSINSNTIEILHFRHVWVFLAMACAIGLAEEDKARREAEAPTAIAPALAVR